jgi:hypothetical protein
MRPVRAAATRRSVWRHRKAGICSTSTTAATSAYWPLSWTSVSTGRPKLARISSNTASAPSSPTPRAVAALGAVGFIKGCLVDEADAEPPGDLLERARHVERMAAAFEHARPGDQRQRQAVAEPDGAGGDDRGRRKGFECVHSIDLGRPEPYPACGLGQHGAAPARPVTWLIWRNAVSRLNRGRCPAALYQPALLHRGLDERCEQRMRFERP